ncbi:MAG: transcription elongation factor GreA [Candidatus Saccharimonadales bacterium]
MNKVYRLTQEGHKALKAELDELVAARPVMAERIKTAREFGDLSENAEYQSARDEQSKNEARIEEIEGVLANAKVLSKSASGSKVELGSYVKLKNDGKTKQFQVVSTVEANPLSGKISDESPLGQALLGKAVGDSVEIATPTETTTYSVTEIF